MSDDLLAKEKEFRRLNEKLQQRTRELMKEVDSVMNPRTVEITCRNVSKLPHRNSCMATEDSDIKGLSKSSVATNLKQSDAISLRRNASLSQIPDRSLHSTVKKKVEIDDVFNDEIILNNKNDVGSEFIIQFLKAKTRMLHNELQTIQLEYKKKCDYCKELEIENKKLDEARTKLFSQATSMKDTLAKMDNSNASLQSKLQTQNTENTALNKEINELKKELKALNQHSSSHNVRLNRTLEDNEKLRSTLKFSQLEEKELRGQVRKLQEDKRTAVKNLEKQLLELTQAFKKQMLLIDNLKRQKAYLEASKQIQFTEENFSKLLEWSPEHLR